jgi:hypothetical protein
MKYIAFIFFCLAALAASTTMYRPGWEVVAVGHPAESKTNNSASDQDYDTIYTIPANYLEENKFIRVTLMVQVATGTSTATATHYLKLGSTKVVTTTAQNYSNGTTFSTAWSFLISGTAAAAASANIETGVYATLGVNTNALNTVTQPVSLATDGALSIIPGITYSGTGSTETCVMRTYIIEILK